MSADRGKTVHDDDNAYDDDADDAPPRRRRSRAGRLAARRDEIAERPRTGAKRTVFQAIQRIPQYLRLLLGLLRDKRVSRIDRLLVLGAIAYVLTPLDFIPDFIPFLGQVDDVFLLLSALQRLVERSDDDVLFDYWAGDPRELSNVNLARIVASAGFFLPVGMRRRLRRMARR